MADTAWGRIQDGWVFETTTDDPEGRFTPDLLWVKLTEGAGLGWLYADGTFQAPPALVEEEVHDGPPADIPPVVPVPAYRTRVSVARFKAMFGLEAQIKIQLARAYVPADPARPDVAKATVMAGLDVLFGALDDLLRSQVEEPVDIADPDVAAGIDWIAGLGFITAAHAATIKRGVPL